MADFTFTTYFNAITAFIIAELTALLQLRYLNHNPFLTIPMTMVVLVSSTILFYLLQVGMLLSPRSRFATVAKHLTLFFAYAAVSSLVAALFPSTGATISIYTIFSLIVAGHALFVMGIFADDEDEANLVKEDEKQTWYKGFATSFRRYKNKLTRSVAVFFEEQTTQPADSPTPR